MTHEIDRRREKRSRSRLPQALKITFKDKSTEPRSLPAKVVDFNSGGIGVEMFVPLPIGSLVEVEGNLHSDDLSLSVLGRARVAHSRRDSDGNYRIGLALQEMALRKSA
jgi:hypothetical protein